MRSQKLFDPPVTQGEFVRTYPGGPIYRVDMVNEARARLIKVSAKTLKDETNEEGEDEEARERKGKTINVSPQALLIRVKREDVIKETESQLKKEYKMSAVGIPVAETTRTERESQRREAMAAKKASKANGSGKAVALVGAAKAAKERAAKSPKAPKTVRECLCGCGEETTGYFAPGHDARFKSWMVKVERGKMEVKDLPKPVQKAYEFKKKGAGFVSATNYKGEKHAGYDKRA